MFASKLINDLKKKSDRKCVGILPSLKAPVGQQEGYFIPNKGWALRAAKKGYRFSEKQKSYLLVASPQTSCGVCSSRVHFSPTWGKNECVTNKPHRTFAGRLTYSLRASSPIWVSEVSLARTRERGGRGKESLQRSLINFHFQPGNPGTPQSVKTVTANVPQIRKVTTACQVS